MDTVSNFILADAIEQATPAQKRRILAQLMEWQRVELRATALAICHDDEAPFVDGWLVQAGRSKLFGVLGTVCASTALFGSLLLILVGAVVEA